jgi:hypothetical protein
MRLIQGNKVFAEWWNTWMSRLDSAHTTTGADVPCEAAPEREHGKKRTKAAALQVVLHGRTSDNSNPLLEEFPLRKDPY